MGICKVCNGAIFANNEVVSYSGAICNNPSHWGINNPASMYYVPPNDNATLTIKILELEKRIEKLEATSKPTNSNTGEDDD